MICNPSQPDSLAKAEKYYRQLCLAGEPFELKRLFGKRSLSQNSYLHLVLQYAACQLGESLEYTKQHYYKEIVNPDIYVYQKYDSITKEMTLRYRSSAVVSKDDMSLSIDRFANWCATAPATPFSLPDPNDKRQLIQAYKTIEENKEYL